jgi:outer membrane protein with beta-barrel domain
MKKFFAATLAVVAFATMSFAQISVSVSPELAIPVGDMADGSKVGFGGTIRGTYDIMPNLAVGLNTGYIMMGEKNKSTSSMVPIELVAIHTCKKLPGLYGGLQIGANYWMFAVDGATDPDSEIKFSAAPFVGYKHKINDKLSVSGDVRYQYAGKFGDTHNQYVGVRLGMNYAL